MLSIATDEAVQMLEAGWRVEYYPPLDAIIWHSPGGDGHGYSRSLDDPPETAVNEARRRGDVGDRPRVPGP